MKKRVGLGLVVLALLLGMGGTVIVEAAGPSTLEGTPGSEPSATALWSTTCVTPSASEGGLVQNGYRPYNERGHFMNFYQKNGCTR